MGEWARAPKRLTSACGDVPAETRRWPADTGRKRRTISPPLRRALEARDRGCRFPGCELRYTDGHHIVHWDDGGDTSLENTLLLCRIHHRLVHEGGWRVATDPEGQAVFFSPLGKPVAGGTDAADGSRLATPPQPGARHRARLQDRAAAGGVA